jgi:3-oxoacyl-[acyl-carrier-protein] synthase-3
MRLSMQKHPVGIIAAACHLPPETTTLSKILSAENVNGAGPKVAALGFTGVHVFTGESPTDMAVEVSRQALAEAGVSPLDLDAVIDFSVMPQRYVEPAWSMSNELQAELGAKNAFTLGFSGGGAANVHAAIKFASALILANDDVDTVLLAASDQAISGNRVIGAGDEPVTVIGDAASALILRRDAGRARVVDTRLASRGALHDVLYIPGGGMRHPTRLDLYKLTLDAEKYAAADRHGELGSLVDALISRHGLAREGIDRFLTAHVSDADLAGFDAALAAGDRLVRPDASARGHLHSSDLVFGLRDLLAGDETPDTVLMASHGMGFSYGATLLRFQ